MRTNRLSIALFCFLFVNLAQGQDQPKLDPDSKDAKTLWTEKFEALKIPSEEILINGGNFNGSKIEDFYMDKTLVTAEQFEACVEAGVCAMPPDNGNWSATLNRNGDKKRPANEISWYMAKSYCDWMGKRLPTADEWEWTARGREEGRIYPWGNDAPTKDNACWMRYDGETDTGNGTCAVGKFAISRDGVTDMAGNLWEWTSTFADDAKTLVVMKGGAWYNDDPEKLKVTYRGNASPYHMDNGSDGFRCVRSK